MREKLTILIIWVIFITFPGNYNKIEAMDLKETNENNQSFLSLEEAKQYAFTEFMKNIWAYPKELAQSIKNTKAGEPLLVQRIDKKDSYYYIVPFNRNDKTTLVVNIDAKTGKLRETSYMREPMRYPRVNQEDAKKILIGYLKDKKIEKPLSMKDPELVWRPCHQTQSPYEPLWKIQIGSDVWFIDQKGKVYEKIIEIKLKGGGVRKDEDGEDMHGAGM
jgi:hypothetical protein